MRKRTWIEPMLATLADKPFVDPHWILEPKLDGERCLVYRDDKEVQLFSRHRQDLNIAYPELVEALRKQKCRQFIVDGEVVSFKPGTTVSSFSRLQRRMHAKTPEAAEASGVPIVFYAFDVLSANGEDLRALPLLERKRILQKTLQFGGRLKFMSHIKDESLEPYQQACHQGWEGLVAKRAESFYSSGRSNDWLKFKCLQEQEFVIGGYTDPEGSRSHFGALLLGYYEGEVLVYAGKVGTGYTQELLKIVGEKVFRLESRHSPFERNGFPRRGIHWVQPKLVAQIAFSEWTEDGKLRQPRFLGLRRDKTAKEVIRETPISAAVVK